MIPAKNLDDNSRSQGSTTDLKKESVIIRFCKFVYWPSIQKFIIFVIIFNSIILGLETSSKIMNTIGGFLNFLEVLCIVIFCVELALKIICEKLSFFKSAWNIFDFLIVAIALVPGSGKLSVLRSLRILRISRLIARLPRLRIIVEAIIRSLPSIGWISFLLVIFFYVFSVLTTNLFGEQYPEWFGSIGASMYTLFQMLTLESWSMGIARPVMTTFPYAYLLFVPFILLSSFVVLNMFIGVIVNTIGEVMNEDHAQASESPGDDGKEEGQKSALHRQPDHLAFLGGELISLKAQLDRIEGLLKKDQKDD
ncbi:MAG: ion transporter [Deltaproteobacteria bacterium]|jgi:voltage-gated sodium channel|nr:ion transporter [Deltaproteobacteria bacterium]